MYVNPSLTSATLALFRPQTSEPTQAPAPMAALTPLTIAKTAEMGWHYADPRASSVQATVFSARTQDAMAAIQSLIANEGAALNRGTKAIWSSQLGRDIPLDTRYTDLSVEDRMSMDREARKADNLNIHFSLSASIASGIALKGQAFILGGEKADMSREELIEDTINGFVSMQINHMKRSFEMAADPEVQALMQDLEVPTEVPEWTTDLEQTLRADLTAKRWAEFERGEIEMTVTIYSGKHAANYDQPYKVLDMRTGEMTVNEANRVEFDKGWEFSDRKKAGFAMMLEGPLGDRVTEGWGEYRDAILQDIHA